MEKLKKGEYYVGDPSYIFGKNWVKVLEDTDYFDNEEIVNVFGEVCVAGGTAYGDGTYTDNFGRKYDVDSGLIGILPVALISIDNKYTISQIKEDEGMHIIEFKEDFKVYIDEGIFKFGDIIIDTTGDDDEDDY